MKTQKEKLKELRAISREKGKVFKEQKAYIHGVQAYILEDRMSGLTERSNMTLHSAYEQMRNGDFL